ncbi:MAG TPA: peptide chain release factor N(5)-glutamine methyltransferase, partial [Pyrinomonadaceae bacterium]
DGLTDREFDTFSALIERRSQREPYQYIVGRQEFYGLEFEVTPDVLIPRPETEILVEAAIKHLSKIEDPHFCEIGIGSGCISVAILHSLPTAIAVAGDISKSAIAVTGRNAARHGVATRLALIESNVFTNLPEQPFDAIISNPPYVPSRDVESLQAEVRDFEPLTSLTDGGDGLSIVRCIVVGAPSRLRKGGRLFMEIGFDQSPAVEAIFDRGVWSQVDFLTDLQGFPRIVAALI